MKLIAVMSLFLAFPCFAAAEEAPQAKVSLRWLGNVGWEIRTGETIILIDPFLTRTGKSMKAEWKTDEEAVLKVITGADFIFAGHSHHDHIGDVPFIAKRYGSRIIGSRTTANIALTAGVDKSRLIVIGGGEKLDFKDFSVRVIESRHGWRQGRAPQNEGAEMPTPLQGPLRGRDFVEGGSFLYEFTFGQHRVLHQSTANFREEKLGDVRPDLALLAVGHAGYNLERVLKILRPKAVIIQHYDQWRSPLAAGIPAANLRRAQRFARDIAAVDDRIKIVIPDFLATYTWPPGSSPP